MTSWPRHERKPAKAPAGKADRHVHGDHVAAERRPKNDTLTQNQPARQPHG